MQDNNGGAESPKRDYPVIPDTYAQPVRPVSFVCVKYSGEYFHNLLKSTCIDSSQNQLITVDNTQNVFFSTLGEAINEGIAQAEHELIAVVHEDLLLLPNWQAMFEYSLTQLEQFDQDWGIVGLAGWDEDEQLHGHLSDPHSYRRRGLDGDFAEVARIDEMFILLRKSGDIFPDSRLPSIHRIGHDLARMAQNKGLKTYVVNAPPIHKYADADGNLVITAKDSDKIRLRGTLTYQADEACSMLYIQRKWGISSATTPTPVPEDYAAMDSPVILLGKGGGGSRLLSAVARNTSLFIGNDVSKGGVDSLEMVMPIYRAILHKFKYAASGGDTHTVAELREAAASMLTKGGWPRNWGFKLPEALLLLPELHEAFPRARYIFLARDPLSTTLRRSHMTARLDNQIGQATLPAAYDAAGLERSLLLSHSPQENMAYATAHQFGEVLDFKQTVADDRWLELRFEELLISPLEATQDLATFCGVKVVSDAIAKRVNPARAKKEASAEFPSDIVRSVTQILEPIRKRLGYTQPE